MGVLSNVLGLNNQQDPSNPDVVAKNKALAPQSTYAAPGDYNSNIGDTVAKENQSYSDQTGFIDSLTQRANGTGGPSVAQNMLRQSTDANTAGVASAVASNRSLSPAQQARLAIEGGAQTQTQAAGQAATLRAQEQTMATSLLGQALGQRGSQNLGELGTLAGAQSGINSLNQATGNQNAQLQLGQEQLAAGVGAGNAATAGALTGGLLAGTGALGPMASSPIKGGGGESLGAGAGAGGSGAGDGAASAYGGDASSSFGLGEGADAAALAFADGGEIAETPLSSYMGNLYGADSSSAASTNEAGSAKPAPPQTGAQTAPAKSKLAMSDSMAAYNQIEGAKLAGAGSIYAGGGRVPALVSPGEIVTPPGTNPKEAARMAETGARKVPGQAHVAGDSPKNDTVKASLTPGSIVLPRTVVNASDPGQAAASFVASVMRRSDKRYAVGGKVVSHQDLSDGGFVDETQAAAPVSVSRGQGDSETKRRMKPAKKPGKEAR